MHTHDRQASKDVLQEVFADVWQKHKQLGQQRDQSIQSYLIKAVEYHSISLLATFPLRERQCLLLQIEQEMPVEEIARRLGITKKAVERNLTSARKRLRKFREALL